MKKYDELTPLGKKRRLHKVAEEALKEYDMRVDKISYLTEETNILFKVQDTNKNKYALKIFQEESSKIEDNLAEVFLINQVAKNSDIKVPEVVSAKNGENIVQIIYEGFEIPKRIALYQWIDGKEIDGREDYDYFYKLGKVAAKLHDATSGIVLPKDINPKKWDKVFYYSGEVAVYKQPKYQKFLSHKFHEIMDFIIPYLNEKLSGYYTSSKPQLLHADLNPYNVWTYRNEIRLIDFEEAMNALPLHDLAIALFYYKYDQNFEYDKVKDKLFEGYNSIKKLPDFNEYDIELLIAARRVNFLNYVLLIMDNPKEYIEVNTERLEKFIKKYI